VRQIPTQVSDLSVPSRSRSGSSLRSNASTVNPWSIDEPAPRGCPAAWEHKREGAGEGCVGEAAKGSPGRAGLWRPLPLSPWGRAWVAGSAVLAEVAS
jgi:hypothetical protein